MQVKRFVAADMRRALELVRQELGPDAIILSSSRIPEGVELLTTVGSDSELMQLQQQPLGKMAFATASPMISDGAWAETEVIERAAKQHAEVPRGASTQTNNGNTGKSGKQLAEEIERARQRMLAKGQAEASAKEFLVDKNTVVNAAIPRFTSPSANTNTASSASLHNSLKELATESVVKASSKPSVDRRQTANRTQLLGRSQAVTKPQEPETSPAKPSGNSKNQSGLSKSKTPMSAAERYPLVDLEPGVKGDAHHSQELQELQAEIADMRFLLEQQLDRLGAPASPMPSSPVLSSIWRRLERLGLPSDIITSVLNRCTKTQSLSDAWPDALANLAHQLPINGRDIVNQGGVFAFVGPTGVGKTTTIGKLAARYVLQQGADKVALITTDTYRIAAHDQLRSLARILRVPVRVVDESNSLESLLRNLRHCTLILIDTAGFRQGDPHLKAQLNALAGQPQIKSYLVMSCNSQEQMLKASVHAYGAARLQGCVLTKLDETASMGEALGVIMQNRLPIVYTTDGQDIPKNLDVARAHQLVAKAAALLRNNPSSAVS